MKQRLAFTGVPMSAVLDMAGIPVSEDATLRGLGVREGQGWLFGRPMTADALLEWMGASVSAASRMRDAWPASVR
ncbi:MAG TPA: hypothetical protein VIJ41_11765 [Candidatus Nanopelagicales bacterium]